MVNVYVLFNDTSFKNVGILRSIVVTSYMSCRRCAGNIHASNMFFSNRDFVAGLSTNVSAVVSSTMFTMMNCDNGGMSALGGTVRGNTDFVACSNNANTNGCTTTVFFLVSVPPTVNVLLSTVPALGCTLSSGRRSEVLRRLITGHTNDGGSTRWSVATGGGNSQIGLNRLVFYACWGYKGVGGHLTSVFPFWGVFPRVLLPLQFPL